MKIIPRLSSLLCLAATAALKAQAPVPVQIASAKSVFLSNLGEEDNGISELAYSTLSAGLGQWGKYQIATAPASADLVLELHYQSLFDGQTVIGGGSLPPNHVPRLRLIILDRATMVPLWSVTEYPVQKSKTSLEQQYETAVNLLVGDLKALAAGQYPAPIAAAKKTPATPTKTRFSQEKHQ